ncbi:hypothetical protein EfmGK941_11380 [Enterococcus faecium]|nr:hypothetical protein EfmGK941_11380 [Enterococcus faecium]
MILLVAEVEDLKADPTQRAIGTVIEARLPSTTVEPQLLQARGVGERTASTTNVFFF